MAFSFVLGSKDAAVSFENQMGVGNGERRTHFSHDGIFMHTIPNATCTAEEELHKHPRYPRLIS